MLDNDYKELITILCEDKEFINKLKNEIVKELSNNYEVYPLNNDALNVNIDMREEYIDFTEYEITSNINEILEKLERNLSWLQRKTSIPTSTLRAIANNTNMVSLKNAFIISRVTGIPIDVLFSFRENGK